MGLAVGWAKPWEEGASWHAGARYTLRRIRVRPVPPCQSPVGFEDQCGMDVCRNRTKKPPLVCRCQSRQTADSVNSGVGVGVFLRWHKSSNQKTSRDQKIYKKDKPGRSRGSQPSGDTEMQQVGWQAWFLVVGGGGDKMSLLSRKKSAPGVMVKT